MGTVAGQFLFICWLTKAISSFAAGYPSKPVKQKHPTPASSSEEKMHLNMKIIDVQSWEGPWRSRAVSVYQEDGGTKN